MPSHFSIEKMQACLFNSSHLHKLQKEWKNEALLKIPIKIRLMNSQDGITKRENSTIQLLLSIKPKF